MRSATVSFAVVLTLGATGCTGSPGDDTGTVDDGPDCSGASEYVDGLAETTPSGRTVKFVSATPAPPDVGDNAWTFEVLDPSGAPEAGLSLEILPWMPMHGHGLVPPTYGSTETDAGTYEIEMFDLIMPGVWQFTVDTAAGTETPDEAVFMLCAEG
ncbi:MAG: FixH family protein [Bryobacterales bacterium]